MKKYLYPLLCMAVAIFSATALVACGDDDDEPTPEPAPVAKNYAKYVGMFSETLFDYYNISVTIEYDKKTETYYFDEKTKKDVVDFATEGWEKDDKRPGRVLTVEPFEYAAHPLKCTHHFELTEAGKQKIANATTEEIDVAYNLNFFKSTKDGLPTFTSNRSEGGYSVGGLQVAKIEEFIDIQTEFGDFSTILQ